MEARDHMTRKGARRKLIGLIMVFVAPLLIAWGAYHLSWSFSSVPASHGTLLSPIQPLPAFMATLPSAKTFSQEDIKGHWWLIVRGEGVCDLYCEADLFKSRQVRLSLGREMTRVGLAYVGGTKDDGDIPDTNLQNILRAHPRLMVLDASELEEVLCDPGIYIVDPNGNLVMYYSRDATSKGMRKDMRLMLKVSQIG